MYSGTSEGIAVGMGVNVGVAVGAGVNVGVAVGTAVAVGTGVSDSEVFLTEVQAARNNVDTDKTRMRVFYDE